MMLLSAFGCSRNQKLTWSMSYRDEGGKIVFVCDGFDLILENCQWDHDPDTFLAGSTIFPVKKSQSISISTSTTPPNPILINENTVEFSFPKHKVRLIDGKFLEVNEKQFDLSEERKCITVNQSGEIIASSAPSKGFADIDYIKNLSKAGKNP